MGPNAGTSNSRLPYLEKIHADLVEKVSALARLRKQVQRKEVALQQRLLIKNNRGTCGGPDRSMLRTVKLRPLVKFSHSNITLAMGQESLVGFMTILIYWRGAAGSGPDTSSSPCNSWSRFSSLAFSAAIF